MKRKDPWKEKKRAKWLGKKPQTEDQTVALFVWNWKLNILLEEDILRSHHSDILPKTNAPSALLYCHWFSKGKEGEITTITFNGTLSNISKLRFKSKAKAAKTLPTSSGPKAFWLRQPETRWLHWVWKWLVRTSIMGMNRREIRAARESWALERVVPYNDGVLGNQWIKRRDLGTN